jgi:hypothetical protein
MLMVRCQKMLRCRADQRKRTIAAPRRESLDASKLRQCEIGTISAPSRLQPTSISGLPEIGSQCRPSRLQPTPISGLPEIGDQSPKSATADLGGGGFPQKIRALKEAGAHFDSA